MANEQETKIGDIKVLNIMGTNSFMYQPKDAQGNPAADSATGEVKAPVKLTQIFTPEGKHLTNNEVPAMASGVILEYTEFQRGGKKVQDWTVAGFNTSDDLKVKALAMQQTAEF